LMQLCVQKKATAEQQEEFGKLWQERVESISKSVSKVIKVIKHGGKSL